METQLTIFEAVLDILCLNPWLLLGFILIGLLLYGFLRKRNHLPKVRIVIGSVLLYYYLCIIFYNIVGIPTRSELLRMAGLGESLFQPNLNLMPLIDGISLGFILNVICFLPLGFLCPMISRTYKRFRYMVLAVLYAGGKNAEQKSRPQVGL